MPFDHNPIATAQQSDFEKKALKLLEHPLIADHQLRLDCFDLLDRMRRVRGHIDDPEARIGLERMSQSHAH